VTSDHITVVIKTIHARNLLFLLQFSCEWLSWFNWLYELILVGDYSFFSLFAFFLRI